MNRGVHIILGVLAIVSLAAAVSVADPIPGTYTSTDLGGALLLGRASQSWVAPLNAAQGLGDVYNAQSWNGTVLGTQWSFSCGQQMSVQGVVDGRVGGTGPVTFTNSFSGGTFSFVNGPWCSTALCSGTANNTIASVIVQYVANVPVAAVANLQTSGNFDNSNCNLTFAIGNGFGHGDTDSFPKPADYPDFLDTACAATRVNGSWADVSQLIARIDCPVPTHKTTWGALKSIYR